MGSGAYAQRSYWGRWYDIFTGNNRGNSAGAHEVLDGSVRGANILEQVRHPQAGDTQVSTPNPIVAAAAPEAVAVLQAIKAFIVSMGPDPAKWVVNYPGAQVVLLGTVMQQLPALAQAEGAAVGELVTTKLDAWITSLQGK